MSFKYISPKGLEGKGKGLYHIKGGSRFYEGDLVHGGGYHWRKSFGSVASDNASQQAKCSYQIAGLLDLALHFSFSISTLA